MSTSRFFRSGGDSSSESSSDEEELYSGEEEEEQEEQSEEEDSDEDEDEDESESESSDSDSESGKKQGASRFLEGWSESEESDTEQTTKVKSAKDKRHDELDATITLITNAEKINDWNIISSGRSHYRRVLRSTVKLTRLQSSTSSTARLKSCALPARLLRLTSSVLPTSKTS